MYINIYENYNTILQIQSYSDFVFIICCPLPLKVISFFSLLILKWHLIILTYIKHLEKIKLFCYIWLHFIG